MNIADQTLTQDILQFHTGMNGCILAELMAPRSQQPFLHLRLFVRAAVDGSRRNARLKLVTS